MRMNFPAGTPPHEQLERAGERKRVGRKHNKTLGPGRKKAQPGRDRKRDAAFRKYSEQMTLYFQGRRDTLPEKP